jgi:hypothetical protein
MPVVPPATRTMDSVASPSSGRRSGERTYAPPGPAGQTGCGPERRHLDVGRCFLLTERGSVRSVGRESDRSPWGAAAPLHPPLAGRSFMPPIPMHRPKVVI